MPKQKDTGRAKFVANFFELRRSAALYEARRFSIYKCLSRFSPPATKFCRLPIGDTAQSGEAATQGARVCDPQELCGTPSVLTNPAPWPLSICCGSQSRAPQNHRGPRRLGQILMDSKSALGARQAR